MKKVFILLLHQQFLTWVLHPSPKFFLNPTQIPKKKRYVIEIKGFEWPLKLCILYPNLDLKNFIARQKIIKLASISCCRSFYYSTVSINFHYYCSSIAYPVLEFVLDLKRRIIQHPWFLRSSSIFLKEQKVVSEARLPIS